MRLPRLEIHLCPRMQSTSLCAMHGCPAWTGGCSSPWLHGKRGRRQAPRYHRTRSRCTRAGLAGVLQGRGCSGSSLHGQGWQECSRAEAAQDQVYTGRAGRSAPGQRLLRIKSTRAGLAGVLQGRGCSGSSLHGQGWQECARAEAAQDQVYTGRAGRSAPGQRLLRIKSTRAGLAGVLQGRGCSGSSLRGRGRSRNAAATLRKSSPSPD
jgi:hypothetical protein